MRFCPLINDTCVMDECMFSCRRKLGDETVIICLVAEFLKKIVLE